MVNRLFAVLVVLLLVVPVAVSADDSGSMIFDQSTMESMSQYMGGVGGVTGFYGPVHY